MSGLEFGWWRQRGMNERKEKENGNDRRMEWNHFGSGHGSDELPVFYGEAVGFETRSTICKY
jgi:hypothetical protein